jgi:RNA polymerase sigma-70 factor (ECF subfamily)
VVPADDEALLIEGLLSDDHAAWRAFEARYSRLIYGAIGTVRGRFPRLISSEDVREIYANLCLQLVSGDKRRLRSFDPERGARFGSWLGLLARHAAYDFLRARRRQPQLQWLGEDTPWLEIANEDAPDAFRICCARERAHILLQLVEDLSPRDREFVELYYWEGLDPEQTAERLGICVGTVYSKKHKIRARIETLLEKRVAA